MSDFLGLLKDDAYAASFQTLGQYRTALIAVYRAEQLSNAAVARRFRNEGGFHDDTDYIQIQPNGDAYIVKINGFSEKTISYDLDRCISFVNEGAWIELEAV